MESRAEQLDYAKKEFIHPTYRYTKVLQQSGGQANTITTVGGQESIFEIPIQAVNFNRSHLDFQIHLPAGGAGNFQAIYYDCFPFIRQLQLYTRSGIYIADINDLANYTKVVWSAETKLSDFLNKTISNTTNAGTGDASRPSLFGLGSLFERSNDISANNLTPTAQASSISYTEPRYYKLGLGANVETTVNIRLPLGDIYNTIFSIDKDIYFGEIILMRIVWHGSQKFSWLQTVVPAYAIQTQNADYANLALYLAIEKNEAIVNSLRSQILSSGMNILTPYVYTYKNNLNGQTATVSLRFNRGHGRRLLKIYTSPFNTVENINTAFDNNNFQAGRISSYYTLLNNERLQEFDLNCRNLDDWSYMKEYLRDTVLQDSKVYQLNWFHKDDWTGKFDKKIDDDNLETGLPLDLEQKSDVYFTLPAPAQYNYYSFAITQKMLTVGPQGITVI